VPTPIRVSNGKFNGSEGDGSRNVPKPAPVATESATPETKVTPRPAFDRPFTWNDPPRVVRRGSIRPNMNYTSMYLEYRNPETGSVRIEWAGELHGTWEGDRDPAAEMISQLRSSPDGYMPYRAVFTYPDEDNPKVWGERDVTLLNGEIRRIAERKYYKNR
jgi:hypothetical protein